MGLFSDDDSQSVRNDSDNIKKSSRFSKYVNARQEENESQENNDNLKTLFGEDAKTKSESSSVGLVLDKSQVEILSGSWHCENPVKLTAYSEEYRTTFPVHEKFKKDLDVPTLDSFISDLFVKKHGQRAFSASSKKTLYSQFMKSIEKLAFQGQNAARMGIITTAYIQQALGTLLQSLCDKEVNLDRTIQSIRDIFAMSTKSLDQIARSGAFHHLIRRKAVMEDTGLSEIKELKNSLVFITT